MWRNGTGWRNIDNLIGASLNNYNVEAIKRDTLEGKRVKALLHSARRKGGEKVADMEREAKAMIDRMAANFNPLSVIKLMGYVMSNVFHRLYQAVFLNEKVSLPSSPSPPPTHPPPRKRKALLCTSLDGATFHISDSFRPLLTYGLFNRPINNHRCVFPLNPT